MIKRYILYWGMLAVILCASGFLHAQMFQLPQSALEVFSPQSGSYYSGPGSNDPFKFAKQVGGDTLLADQSGIFALYKVHSLLFFFGPYNSTTSCEQAVARLRRFRDRELSSLEEYEFIVITMIELSPSGPKLSTRTQIEEQPLGNGAEREKLAGEIKDFLDSPPPTNTGEAEKQLGELKAHGMAMLRQSLKGSPGSEGALEQLGGHAKKLGEEARKDGAKGPFKVSTPFSKWFSIMVDILTEFLLPGELKKIATKALMVAYMMMPEVFDQVASTLAEIQRAATPKSVDGFLNNVANIADKAYDLYRNFKRIYKFVNDPNFKEIVSNANLGDLDEELKRMGIDTGVGKVCQNKFAKHLCNLSLSELKDLETMTPGQIKGFAKQKVKDYTNRKLPELLQNTGIPILENLDINVAVDFVEGKIDPKAFFQKQAEKVLCPMAPKTTRDACATLVREDFSGEAFKQVTRDALARETAKRIPNLDEDEVLDMIGDLEKGDLGGFSEKIGDEGLDYFAKENGLDGEKLKAAIDYLKKGNLKEGLRNAAMIGEDKLQKYFGKYHTEVSAFLQSNNWNDVRGVANDATKRFLGNVISNSALRSLGTESVDFFNEVIIDAKSPELYLKEQMQALGMDTTVINAFTSGQQIDKEAVLETIARELGLLGPEAIKKFKDGAAFEEVLDAEIEYLNQNLHPAGYTAHQKDKFKRHMERLKSRKQGVKSLAKSMKLI